MTLRPLTPKEFSAAIGGLRGPRWVRAECARFVSEQERAKRQGRPARPVGIVTLTPRPPYIIPAAELEKFRPPLAPFAVQEARSA